MHRIDIHHHILPSFYTKSVGTQKIGAQGSSGKIPFWSVEDALARMDASGIRTSITSITAPGLAVEGTDKEMPLARQCNEFAAELVQEHPGRFGMFSTVPVSDIDMAIREVVYAYDTFMADGVCLLSNHCGKYLGDLHYEPLYDELNRRRAVVFVHPTSPATPVPVAGLSASSLDFTFDTARTLFSLIFNGVFQKYPDIRFIFSHMGGAAPYIADRIEVLSRNNPTLLQYIPQGIRAALRHCFFDTALSANTVTFSAMLQVCTVENLLFGTDYPFGPRDQMSDAVCSLESLGLEKAQLRKIEMGNAQALLPRFA